MKVKMCLFSVSLPCVAHSVYFVSDTSACLGKPQRGLMCSLISKAGDVQRKA